MFFSSDFFPNLRFGLIKHIYIIAEEKEKKLKKND